jgi:F0F1-type ATP synthase assembly protein I
MAINLNAEILERRLFWMGALLVIGGSILTWPIFGFRSGLSVLVGGALGGLNLGMLRSTINSTLLTDARRSKRRIIGSYLLRLLLIPICLYVMIRFLFIGIPAAVGGFALFNCSILVEGILEAFKASSK